MFEEQDRINTGKHGKEGGNGGCLKTCFSRGQHRWIQWELVSTPTAGHHAGLTIGESTPKGRAGLWGTWL